MIIYNVKTILFEIRLYSKLLDIGRKQGLCIIVCRIDD